MEFIILLICFLALCMVIPILAFKICSNPKIMIPAIQREYSLFQKLSYDYPTDKLSRLLMMINLTLPKITDRNLYDTLSIIREDVSREIDRRDYFDKQKQKF